MLLLWCVFLFFLFYSFYYDKMYFKNTFSSVQSLSRVRLFATPWIPARQASLSIANSQSLPKLMSIQSVKPSSHLILCRPLLLLPPIPPSIRVFSNESTLRMRWPKYWSFSFSIIPSKEHPGLISFRMDWLDLLAVQGTFKSLLQHYGSKASILWHSAFFTVIISLLIMAVFNTHLIKSLKFNSWLSGVALNQLWHTTDSSLVKEDKSAQAWGPEVWWISQCLALEMTWSK